jgi:hypothetical protein
MIQGAIETPVTGNAEPGEKYSPLQVGAAQVGVRQIDPRVVLAANLLLTGVEPCGAQDKRGWRLGFVVCPQFHGLNSSGCAVARIVCTFPKSFRAATKESAFPALTSVMNWLRSKLAQVSSCWCLASIRPNTNEITTNDRANYSRDPRLLHPEKSRASASANQR